MLFVTLAVLRTTLAGRPGALILAVLALAAVYTLPAFGHGLGLDTTPPIDVGERRVSVTVEIPSYNDRTDQRQVTVSAADTQTGEPVSSVTYRMGVLRDGNVIFRDHFFARDGILYMDVQYAGGDEIGISGARDPLLGAWYGTPDMPLEITGPVFESGGLYTFEIEIRTTDDAARILDDPGVHAADVTIVEVAESFQKDGDGNDVKFRTKSYFDSIESFAYDPAAGQVTLGMPFDWGEKKISHIPVVHVEIHFPKGFAEFLTPSYTGTVNGIELFKASVSVDDYTEDDERIVHFVLLKDHIRHIKNQLSQLGEPAGDSMIFTLETAGEVEFPVSAWTRDESFQVDLSWDPVEILPGQETKFVYTVRDAATAEPMRNSGFDFVILQGGKEIHRQYENAQIGGGFVDYEFTEDQTGPTVIRFEDIRGSGLSTEFGIVVAPEFGVIAPLVLVAGISSVILLGRRFPPHN